MEIKFKIKRKKDENSEAFFQTFTIDTSSKETVLNTLLKIRAEQDRTLGLRCSCRSAICGSCAMQMNGKTSLACNTQIEDLLEEGSNEIVIEAAGNQKIIRDLIVDLDMFWNKIKETTPYLNYVGEKPKREHLCSNEDMLHLSEVTECILCGSCVSACTVLEVDKSFMGPAALAKIYRFVCDPRDGIDDTRLAKASAHTGIWDCTHCFKCIEACPKRVAPMDRIVELRKIAMDKGYINNTGSRHSKAIVDSVKHSGTLNELTVMPKSHGWWNIKEMLALVPTGLKMMKRGKMPKLMHPKLSTVKNIKKIFNRFEKK